MTNITLTLFIRLNKLNFLKIIMKNSNKWSAFNSCITVYVYLLEPKVNWVIFLTYCNFRISALHEKLRDREIELNT